MSGENQNACKILRQLLEIRRLLKKFKQEQEGAEDVRRTGEDAAAFKGRMNNLGNEIEVIVAGIENIMKSDLHLASSDRLHDFTGNLRRGITSHKQPSNITPEVPEGTPPPGTTHVGLDYFVQDNLVRLRELCGDETAEGPVNDLDF